MDDLDLLRAVRPQDTYPGELRETARGRLLAAAAAEPAHRAQPARQAHRRRIPRFRLAAGLAFGAAAAVTAAAVGAHLAASQTAGSKVAGPRVPVGSHPLTGSQVLLLAAKAARTDTPPPGTRWIVTEERSTTTGVPGPYCGAIAKSATSPGIAKIRQLVGSCAAQAPASLSGLRGAKPFDPAGSISGLDPASLPDEPAALLKAIYRWDAANHALGVLHFDAFDILRGMLTSGVTSPSPAVQLQALALIPGISVDTHVRNAVGRPGIGVTFIGKVQKDRIKEEIIFDSQTYQNTGGVVVEWAPGGSQTITTTAIVWQAYYNADGHRL